MVAHGTIAFDTLTTSDQVNTGTEKSIDTSYVFNGTPRAWMNYGTSASFSIFGSFNISSLSDQGAGSAHITATNGFADETYTYIPACNNYHILTDASGSNKTTSLFAVFSYAANSGNTQVLGDASDSHVVAIGDLA